MGTRLPGVGRGWGEGSVLLIQQHLPRNLREGFTCARRGVGRFGSFLEIENGMYFNTIRDRFSRNEFALWAPSMLLPLSRRGFLQVAG